MKYVISPSFLKASLLAQLPLFIYALRFDTDMALPCLSLVTLLLVHLFFNLERGAYKGMDENTENRLEREAMNAVVNNFIPRSGRFGEMSLPPVKNITLPSKPHGAWLGWGLLLFAYTFEIITMTGELPFSPRPYVLPLIGLALLISGEAATTVITRKSLAPSARRLALVMSVCGLICLYAAPFAVRF